MNTKIVKRISAFLIIFFVFPSMVYRFRHPEKTETQLFIDMLKGKVHYELVVNPNKKKRVQNYNVRKPHKIEIK